MTAPVPRPGPDVIGRLAEAQRAALRTHHPIMRSETGPFSGCRCGGVKLGQDVIEHVLGELAAALLPVVRELQAEVLEAAAEDLRAHGVGPEVFVVDDRAAALRGEGR